MSGITFKSQVGLYTRTEEGPILKDENGRPLKDENGWIKHGPSTSVQHKTYERKRAEHLILSGQLENVMDLKISVAKIQVWLQINREFATEVKAVLLELLKECTVTVQAKQNTS